MTHHWSVEQLSAKMQIRHMMGKKITGRKILHCPEYFQSQTISNSGCYREAHDVGIGNQNSL